MCEEEITCRVVLLGECGVGKTSIISRYIFNTFELSYSGPGVSGGNYGKKKSLVEDESQMIEYEIWNTIGQEAYRSLTRLIYREADACILVYDITSRRSFEELKVYWANEMKIHAPSNISKK